MKCERPGCAFKNNVSTHVSWPKPYRGRDGSGTIMGEKKAEPERHPLSKAH